MCRGKEAKFHVLGFFFSRLTGIDTSILNRIFHIDFNWLLGSKSVFPRNIGLVCRLYKDQWSPKHFLFLIPISNHLTYLQSHHLLDQIIHVQHMFTIGAQVMNTNCTCTEDFKRKLFFTPQHLWRAWTSQRKVLSGKPVSIALSNFVFVFRIYCLFTL